jgi:hypothetical protein
MELSADEIRAHMPKWPFESALLFLAMGVAERLLVLPPWEPNTAEGAVHSTKSSLISKHNSQRTTLGSCKTTSLGHRSADKVLL